MLGVSDAGECPGAAPAPGSGSASGTESDRALWRLAPHRRVAVAVPAVWGGMWGGEMIVIICGGRSYVFTHEHRTWLDALHEQELITCVVTGGATGADAEGDAWARCRGIDRVIFPANWKGRGKSAGPVRNTAMLAFIQWLARRTPHDVAVIAFPGGSGTRNMVRQGQDASLRVYEYGKQVTIGESHASISGSDSAVL